MKKGFILINAYSSLPSSLNQSRRLKEEFEKSGVKIDVLRNIYPLYTRDDGGIENRLPPYDFCVYLDKDKYASALLEKAGVPLFNSRAAIQACDDKMTTHILLSGRGVPMPKTIPGLLCYDPEAVTVAKWLDFIEKELGYPMIVKAVYGSLGRDVYKIDDRARLEEIAEKLKLRPHLFQRFVADSAGKDIRVVVIGGEAIAAMERKSADDFRSNLELGGVGAPVKITHELEKLCVYVAKILGLDYCGIDVLEEKGKFLICEVNSNAFFGGIEKVTGVNVAEAYARHILRTVYGD